MARTLTCPRCGLNFEDVRGDGQHGIHGQRVRFGPDPEDVCTHLARDPEDCWDCFSDRLALGPLEPSGA